MWRKSILFSLVTLLAFSFAFAGATNVIGEDNSRIGLIKAKLENNETLTRAEKAMAWENGLFEEQIAPPAYYNPSSLRTAYLEEGFETWPPAGWTLDPATGNGAWLQGAGTTHGPGSVVEGTSAAWFNDYDYSSGTAGTMTSPAIDLTAGVAPRVSFWYWDSGSSDFITVLVSTDNTTFTSVYTTATTVTPWTEIIVDLTAYAGNATVYIRFAAVSVWGTSNPHIDAFSVSEAPTGPVIGLSTAAIDFGGVMPGMSADAVLTISNNGGGPLEISSILPSSYPPFAIGSYNSPLAAGSTMDVTITFAPIASGDFSGDVTITSDDPDSPHVITVAGSGAPTSGGPGAAGYSWISSFDAAGPTFAWIDSTGSTSSNIANGDDYRGTIALPFPVRFDEVIYNEITGTTNGWIGMGPSTGYSSSYYNNVTMPVSSVPNNVIAPFWDDLKAGGTYHGTMVHKTVGSEPNRQFAVIWQDVYRSGAATDDWYTFEVIFDEATSDIYFQYLDVSIANALYDNGKSATVGLENSDGSDALLIGFNGAPQGVYANEVIHFIAPPPPSVPNMVLDVSELNFGAVVAGGSAQADVTITNSGAGDLVISGVSIAAPFSSTFSETIASAGSAVATISFDPGAAGDYSETLAFTVTGDYTGSNELDVMGSAYPDDFVMEGFEGTFPPFGWSIIDVDGLSAFNPSLAYISPHSGAFGAEGMGCQNDYLVTPLLAIPAGYAPLSFWVGQESVSYQNSFEIMVSTTGTASTDFVQVADFPMYTRSATTAWTMESVDLSAYAGQDVYVAIHVYYSESSSYGFGFDDFIMPPLVPSANTLFFSEYMEGSSNNKAIEIYNGTGAEVDLSDYVILRYNNGAIIGADSTSLTGMLANDEVYVIANSAAIQGILDAADETGTVTYYNGDDYLGLVFDANGDDIFDIATEVVDVIGVLGEDPGTNWPVAGGLGATSEFTLMRKASVVTGNTDWALSAGTNADDSEWLVFEQNYWYGLGYHNEAYPGPGDVCALAIELTLPVEGMTGSSDGFADDYSYSGSSYMNGIDIVYSFSIPEDGSISGNIADGGGDYTGMFVMDNCPDVDGAMSIAQATGYSGGSFTDVAIAAGDYYLVVSNWPTPNDFVYTFDLIYTVGPPPMVDFVVSEMWANEDTVFALVTNQGDADSPGYFGTDYHGWFIDEAYIGYAAGPALEAGGSATFFLTGLNWDNLGAGIFEIGLVADVDDDTEESDEENNYGFYNFEVAYPASVPRNLEADLNFTTVSLTWDPAPPPLEVASLSTGASSRLAAVNSIARIDKNVMSPALLETKLAQQSESAAYQAKSASGMRDLRETGDTCDDPLALTLPVVAMAGTSVGFADDYSYTGSSYMNGIDIVYSFSIPETGSISGDIVDPGYQYSGMFVLADCPDAAGVAIAMGTGSSGGSFANVPINAGDYFLVVSNWPTPNEFTYTFNLTFTAGAVPSPDFIVDEMWLDNGTVYAAVTNQGTVDSPGYFGTDYHGWFVNGDYLGYASGPALLAGASATFTLEGFDYANVGPGTFNVDFVADVDNDTYESNEDNNTASLEVVIAEPTYIPTFNVYRDDVLVAEDLEPTDFAFHGAYMDTGVPFGEHCYVVSQNMEDLSESEGSDAACVSVRPNAPMDLIGSAANAVVNLSWLPPIVIETGWLGYHDDTFENGYASTDGGAGIATMFTPMVYPAIVEQVQFHVGDYGSFDQEIQVFILGGDGVTVLGGPYAVNGVADGWVTIDIDDITIETGAFMVATYNTLAGGPYIDVDEDHYAGNLYFGDHTLGFDEMSLYDIYAVGSHEAYLNYDGTTVLVTADMDNSNNPRTLGTPSKTKSFASVNPVSATINTNLRRYTEATSAIATRDLLGYNVYRGTGMGELAFLALATDIFYVDATVENGTTYYYEVTATYDEGESLPTNMVMLTPQGAAGLPFFSDFEADAGGFSGDGDWAWGVPDFVDGPDTAYSLTKLWGTVLDGDYPNNSDSWLSQPFDLSGATGSVVLSFMTWFDLESGWDYVYVAIDHDNDGVYNILAEYNGNSGGWIEQSIIVAEEFVSDYAKVAFIFQSDGSVQYPGFYLDDFSVVDLPLPVLALDIDPDFGVDIAYGETSGSDDFSILNAGVADLEYMLSYEVAAGRNTGSREILGANAYSTTWPVVAGTTVNLSIYVQNESSDAEWIDSVNVAFPAGITVNSISNMMVVNGTRYLEGSPVTAGDTSAAWFNWDGGYGNLYSTDLGMATVNVTIDAAYVGDVYFDWFLAGDIFGAEPHEVSGTFVFMEPALEVALSPMSGTLTPTSSDLITGSVTVNRYEEGYYPGFIGIESNDPQNPYVLIPFNIFLGGPAGTLAGTITSAYDNGPMADVMIEAKESTTLEEYGTMSMADGTYTLVLPVGNYDIRMGYEDYHVVEMNVNIVLGLTTTVDMAMSPDVLAPTDLVAEEVAGGVSLSWIMPTAPPADVEGFEGGVIPADWSIVDQDGDGANWGVWDLFAHSGIYSLASFSWSSASGPLTPNNYLITPQIDVGEGAELRFWVGASDADWYWEHFNVMLSVGGSNPVDFNVELLDYTLTTDVWTEVVVDLSGYAGLSVYVAWVHNEVTDVFNLSLDDISLTNDNGEALFTSTFETPADLEQFEMIPFRVAEDMTEAQIQTRLAEYEASNAASSLRSEFLFFKVYSNVDGAGWNMVAASNDPVYLDETPLAGQSIEYKVTAQYDIAESDYSNTVQLQVVGVDELGIPTEFALYQNYPNPFNPVTTITYDIPEASDVRLVIYNLVGQPVRILVKGYQNPSHYTTTWNGLSDSGLPVSSGIYIYRLESASYVKTMKMMYLK